MQNAYAKNFMCRIKSLIIYLKIINALTLQLLFYMIETLLNLYKLMNKLQTFITLSYNQIKLVQGRVYLPEVCSFPFRYQDIDECKHLFRSYYGIFEVDLQVGQ